MKVVVTGYSGFVGKRLVEQLHIAQLEPVFLGRSRVSGEWHKFDLGGSNISFIGLVGAAVVIHCAGRAHVMKEDSLNALEEYRKINTFGTLELARHAAAAGVKRFIFVSSIKVNGEGTQLGNPFSHNDPQNPQDFYAQSKAEAEVQLRILADETGMEVVIIRPPLVYGAGVKANLAALFGLINKGIPLPFACLNSNRRSLISLQNLVSFIVTCVAHPEAGNKTFLVSDGNDLSTADIVRYIAKSLGKKGWMVPVPQLCYQLAGKILRKEDTVDRLLGSLQIDNSRGVEILGWQPVQTVADGFQEAAEAFTKEKG